MPGMEGCGRYRMSITIPQEDSSGQSLAPMSGIGKYGEGKDGAVLRFFGVRMAEEKTSTSLHCTDPEPAKATIGALFSGLFKKKHPKSNSLSSNPSPPVPVAPPKGPSGWVSSASSTGPMGHVPGGSQSLSMINIESRTSRCIEEHKVLWASSEMGQMLRHWISDYIS